jgi:hypothetical protein
LEARPQLAAGKCLSLGERLRRIVAGNAAVERHRWARLTLEAHLIKLAREARARERDGVWRLSRP